MRRRLGVLAGLCAVLTGAGASVALRPEPQPLAFLDGYPLRSIFVAQANAPAPGGQALRCRTYAVTGSPETVRKRLDREAEARGMPFVLSNADRTWLREDRTLSVRLTARVPAELAAPEPGAKGYIVAYEPERVTLMDRVWRAWLRWRYP